MDSLRRVAVVSCLLALAAAACGDDDGGTPAPMFSDAAVFCTDNDEDGFGRGCANGEDCDDDDPDITAECPVCFEGTVREGCPCEPQEGMECVPDPIPHPEGLLVCREGTRFCRDGEWTECEPLGDYVLIRN